LKAPERYQRLGGKIPKGVLIVGAPGMPKESSERTAEAIDAEIQKLLEVAHGRVRETLTPKRAALETLAKRLIEKEVVDRETLAKLIAGSGGQ
jgi:cell division protease FtsH